MGFHKRDQEESKISAHVKDANAINRRLHPHLAAKVCRLVVVLMVLLQKQTKQAPNVLVYDQNKDVLQRAMCMNLLTATGMV